MIKYGACVPVPGLHARMGVYALAVGVLSPQVLVDPMIRGKQGEQALVAHELCHVSDKHALKLFIWLGITFALGCLTLFLWLARGPLVVPNVSIWLLGSSTLLAGLFIPQLLRICEIDADKAALAATSPAEFVSFVHMHPHPKGRWGRWLYGANTGDRISRVLP